TPTIRSSRRRRRCSRATSLRLVARSARTASWRASATRPTSPIPCTGSTDRRGGGRGLGGSRGKGRGPGGRRVGAGGAAPPTRLRRAVRRSQRRLPDGSLFIPMRLLDDERPYASVVEARSGSYWNLVAPYAFASGLLDRAQEAGALRYLLLHGSRLLGLVRAG